MSYGYTAAATLLALLLYLSVTLNVGKARTTYKVKASATRERALRARLSRPDEHAGADGVFPAVAVALRLFLSDIAAAAGGLVWIIGRALYAMAYIRDPASRGRGRRHRQMLRQNRSRGAARPSACVHHDDPALAQGRRG